MLPAYLLSYSAAPGGFVVPDYLNAADYPWLRALLDEYRRFVGRQYRELAERMREPLPCPSPRHKRLMAMHLLDRMSDARPPSTFRPRQIRAAVFAAAAGSAAPADEISARVAAELGISTTELSAALLADVRSERRVGAVGELSPVDLALRCNLALAQGLVKRAEQIRIRLRGNAHAIVRIARLRGLICLASRDPAAPLDTQLVLSGPLALFRRTTMYGRALASLVGALSWCEAYELCARVELQGITAQLQLRSGDPIAPNPAPRRYDSKLEKRFARDFGRAAPDWDVVREPAAIHTPEGMIFPDFALRHRRDPARSWLLEIVGFWTPAYLEHKLCGLRAAHIDNLILCIDNERNCADQSLPTGARIIGYRKRIDARRVLDIVEAPGAGSPP